MQAYQGALAQQGVYRTDLRQVGNGAQDALPQGYGSQTKSFEQPQGSWEGGRDYHHQQIPQQPQLQQSRSSTHIQEYPSVTTSDTNAWGQNPQFSTPAPSSAQSWDYSSAQHSSSGQSWDAQKYTALGAQHGGVAGITPMQSRYLQQDTTSSALSYSNNTPATTFPGTMTTSSFPNATPGSMQGNAFINPNANMFGFQAGLQQGGFGNPSLAMMSSMPPSAQLPTAPINVMNTPRIYISNLPTSITTEQLGAAFACCGKIRDVMVMHSKGFGFVQFDTPAEATAAVRLNGCPFAFGGETTAVLRIDFARGRDPPPKRDRSPTPPREVILTRESLRRTEEGGRRGTEESILRRGDESLRRGDESLRRGDESLRRSDDSTIRAAAGETSRGGGGETKSKSGAAESELSRGGARRGKEAAAPPPRRREPSPEPFPRYSQRSGTQVTDDLRDGRNVAQSLKTIAHWLRTVKVDKVNRDAVHALVKACLTALELRIAILPGVRAQVEGVFEEMALAQAVFAEAEKPRVHDAFAKEQRKAISKWLSQLNEQQAVAIAARDGIAAAGGGTAASASAELLQLRAQLAAAQAELARAGNSAAAAGGAWAGWTWGPNGWIPPAGGPWAQPPGATPAAAAVPAAGAKDAAAAAAAAGQGVLSALLDYGGGGDGDKGDIADVDMDESGSDSDSGGPPANSISGILEKLRGRRGKRQPAAMVKKENAAAAAPATAVKKEDSAKTAAGGKTAAAAAAVAEERLETLLAAALSILVKDLAAAREEAAAAETAGRAAAAAAQAAAGGAASKLAAAAEALKAAEAAAAAARAGEAAAVTRAVEAAAAAKAAQEKAAAEAAAATAAAPAAAAAITAAVPAAATEGGGSAVDADAGLEAALMAVAAVWLSGKSMGATMDDLLAHLQQLSPTVTAAQVDKVLKGHPTVFGKLGRAGVFWTFTGFNSI